SRLYRPLEADDTEAMREALRSLGVLIDDNDDPWLVLGTGGELEASDVRIDVRASGTTARFITAVAALARGRVVVDGVRRMRARPRSTGCSRPGPTGRCCSWPSSPGAPPRSRSAIGSPPAPASTALWRSWAAAAPRWPRTATA